MVGETAGCQGTRMYLILCSLVPGSGRSSDCACEVGRRRARGVAPGRGTRRRSRWNHYPGARPLKAETRVRIPLGPPSCFR